MKFLKIPLRNDHYLTIPINQIGEILEKDEWVKITRITFDGVSFIFISSNMEEVENFKRSHLKSNDITYQCAQVTSDAFSELLIDIDNLTT